MVPPWDGCDHSFNWKWFGGRNDLKSKTKAATRGSKVALIKLVHHVWIMCGYASILVVQFRLFLNMSLRDMEKSVHQRWVSFG